LTVWSPYNLTMQKVHHFDNEKQNKKEQSSSLESVSQLASSESHFSGDGGGEILAKRWERKLKLHFLEREVPHNLTMQRVHHFDNKKQNKKEQSSNLESASRLTSSESHLSNDRGGEILAKWWERKLKLHFLEREVLFRFWRRKNTLLEPSYRDEERGKISLSRVNKLSMGKMTKNLQNCHVSQH